MTSNPQIRVKPRRVSVDAAASAQPQIVVHPRQTTLNVEQSIGVVLQVGKQGPAGRPGGGGGGGASYDQSFTQADLSIAGVLVVEHGLDSYPSGVSVWSSAGEALGPDRVEVFSLDTIAVTLSSFIPLQGTAHLSITT